MACLGYSSASAWQAASPLLCQLYGWVMIYLTDRISWILVPAYHGDFHVLMWLCSADSTLVTQSGRQLLKLCLLGEIQYSADLDRTCMDVRQHRKCIAPLRVRKALMAWCCMITVPKAGCKHNSWICGKHLQHQHMACRLSCPIKWHFVAAWWPADWMLHHRFWCPQQPHEAALNFITLLQGFACC